MAGRRWYPSGTWIVPVPGHIRLLTLPTGSGFGWTVMTLLLNLPVQTAVSWTWNILLCSTGVDTPLQWCGTVFSSPAFSGWKAGALAPCQSHIPLSAPAPCQEICRVLLVRNSSCNEQFCHFYLWNFPFIYINPPHKENDKGIVEETSDQIKSISGLRDELANLEKQRGSMSTDKYLKAEQKIPSNFIFQFS